MDEQTANDAPVTTETAPVETPAAPAPVETTPEPPTVDWQAELERADAKELRKHPKIAGMIGSELQRAVQAERERLAKEATETAQREAAERLERLAREDPDTFIQQWMSDQQRQKIMGQINEMHGKARKEMGEAIGRAFRDLPEWAELTDEDHQKLAEALSGKHDDEVLPLFNRHALELVAERRAKKQMEQWRTKELAKEREAIRQEEAAKLLRESEAPDARGPKGQARQDVGKMPQEDFDKYWNSLKGL